MNPAELKQDYEAMRNEYHICKRKLDSKCEALLILTRDLDQCRQERDQFKLMAEQVQSRYQAIKRQLAGVGPRPSVMEGLEYSDMKQQSLAQLLCEMREVNKVLQFEVDDLKQKLGDGQGDIKLLREQIARQRVGSTDEGLNMRHFPAHEREELVRQLEASREQYMQIERDLQQVLDEKEELVTERDVYKTKYERLNQELNYILKGDEKRIVDIDALSMENKYLQERLKQMEEEKSIAMATASKYKNLLERKKSKGILKLGQNRSGGVVISQKQVEQLIETKSTSSPTPQMLSDLQAVASALLDTMNDKNLALSHQRKTNKILGSRVSELEKKLKTLEVSGLWNLTSKTPSDSLEKLKQECEEIKTLIPTRLSQSSENADLLADSYHSSISSSPSKQVMVSDDESQRLDERSLLASQALERAHMKTEENGTDKQDSCGSPTLRVSPDLVDHMPSPTLQSLDPFYSEQDPSVNHIKDIAELSPDQVVSAKHVTGEACQTQSEIFSLRTVEALMDEITSHVTACQVKEEGTSIESSSSPQCSSPLITH